MSDTCDSWNESSDSECGIKVKDSSTNQGKFVANILYTNRKNVTSRKHAYIVLTLKPHFYTVKRVFTGVYISLF